MKNIFIRFLLLSVCLLSGLIIYLCSGRNIYVTSLVNLQTISFINTSLSFYIPDLLWAFSFYIALSIVNNNYKADYLIVVTAGCFLEILQYLNLISGTGDIYDVLIEILGAYIAYVAVRKGKI